MRQRVLLVAAITVLPSIAQAHFRLVAPAPQYAQDGSGNPQVAAPCGDNNGTLLPTITTVMAGSTLTLTIDETITHYGHYRVALAQDESGLPADPPVSPGTTACGSAPIDSSPALPLLADGVFVHTSAFSGDQTTQIAIPAGTTCTDCVLQILEFMTNHAAPCFYYHCARVTVTTGAVPDAGLGGGGDDSGGCNSGGHGAPSSGFALMLLGALVRRRAARR